MWRLCKTFPEFSFLECTSKKFVIEQKPSRMYSYFTRANKAVNQHPQSAHSYEVSRGHGPQSTVRARKRFCEYDGQLERVLNRRVRWTQTCRPPTSNRHDPPAASVPAGKEGRPGSDSPRAGPLPRRMDSL